MPNPQKILIVDDKPANLFALEQILSGLEAEVIKAESGNAALTAALNHDFALAIVDVQMPEMDGYELAELLRSQKHTQDLPIIFLSAVFYDDQHVFRGYDAGAVDFITKPYPPRILMGKAAVFLELSRKRLAVEHMAGQLQNANQVLERRVRERTLSLEQTVRALQESERNLRLLSGRLLSAQEEERKRIAAELHDSIGSSLGAIKFGIESTFSDPGLNAATRNGMDGLVQMVIHTIDEVRRIIRNLRPPVLDRCGLLTAVNQFQQNFETVYEGIDIHTRIDAKEEEIPDLLKIVIYRVIQEAFHNMAKYSRASRAHLEIVRHDAWLDLRIHDDGVGFDAQAVVGGESPGQGLGLTSMRERVELSGGRFTLESARNRGTRIEVAWQLDKESN